MATYRSTRSRILAVATALASAAFALTGCSSPATPSGTSASGPPKLHIAYANISDASAQFKAITDQMKENAAKLGWTIDTYDNAQDAATTLSNAKTMAASDADVLIDWASADGVQAAVGKTFAASGKPCISVNAAIPGCPLLNIDNSIFGKGSGNNLAEAATAEGWTAENTTFIGVNYAKGGANTQALIAAAAQEFSAKFKGFPKITSDQVTLGSTNIGSNFLQVDGNGHLAETNTALRAALQNIPASQHLAIVTVNNDSALGVLSALEATGRSSEALIASTGSTPDGLKNLRTNPAWVSEGGIYFNYWAGYLMAMAQAKIDGTNLPDLTVAPQNNLTKANVDTYFNGTTPIKAPELDPSADYLRNTAALKELGLTG